MTLKVWLFCLCLSLGVSIGHLIFDIQTAMLWKAAAERGAYTFFGSIITAFYFTRPGFLSKLTRPAKP